MGCLRGNPTRRPPMAGFGSRARHGALVVTFSSDHGAVGREGCVRRVLVWSVVSLWGLVGAAPARAQDPAQAATGSGNSQTPDKSTTLLPHPDTPWWLSGQLGASIPAPSLALVNKVVQHLRDQAFVKPLATGGFQLSDPEGLLREWRAAYRVDRHSRHRLFTLLEGRALHDTTDRWIRIVRVGLPMLLSLLRIFRRRTFVSHGHGVI